MQMSEVHYCIDTVMDFGQRLFNKKRYHAIRSTLLDGVESRLVSGVRERTVDLEMATYAVTHVH